MAMRTGAQIIWESLLAEGVHTVFGYPGGAILPAYDAMLDYPIRHVLVRHEQGATHMADGYARAGGGVGVALATSGPGATNLVTGIATAMMDSTPMVCITGQVPSSLLGRDAFQETDITGITLPITKHNFMITRVEDIAPAIRAAFRLAQTGRPGPVLVDITKDAQQARFDFEVPARPRARQLPPIADASLVEAARLIAQAERPLIFAGHGVLRSGAMAELRALAERASVPVAVTLLGIGGLPREHPLNLGMMGMHGEAWVNDTVQRADLLIALGMRFDDRVTGDLREYAQNARKIHVDIDPSEFNKNVKTDVAIAGDLRAVLQRLLPHVPTADRREWLDEIAASKLLEGELDEPTANLDGPLLASHVLQDLSRATNGSAILVTDVGQHQMWAAQHYRTTTPHTWITSGGLGTMGFGLPAALGAKLARPDANVWAVVGDGGFQMTQAELATATQEGIKVNIAVINNGYLGMVRQWQELFHQRRYAATPITSPDLVMLAHAHGLLGRRVTSRREVDEAIAWAEGEPNTVIVDFRVQQEQCVYPMVAPGAAIHNMIRRPASERFVETGADA
jgi:acetolactate synthase I/II/III large subunit